MTCEKASGVSWEGMLSDGTIDMEKIAESYKQHVGSEFDNPYRGVADMLWLIRKRLRMKSPYRDSSEHECGQVCDSIRTVPFCENYVLGIQNHLDVPEQVADDSYIIPIKHELSGHETDRFILLTLSNCAHLTDCTEEALGELGFVERPKEDYQNYEAFRNASQKLIRNTILYFEAPCLKVSEYLQKQGFSGEHATYC